MSNDMTLFGALRGLAALQDVLNCRELAHQSPEHLPNLARALNTMACEMSAAGLHEEALTNLTEAVEMYRELMKPNPDDLDLLFGMAMALYNRERELDLLNRREEALADVVEAIELFKQLRRQGHRLRTLAPLIHLWRRRRELER